jgi:hypothetical protein
MGILWHCSYDELLLEEYCIQYIGFVFQKLFRIVFGLCGLDKTEVVFHKSQLDL